jgi:hypothetical protein
MKKTLFFTLLLLSILTSCNNKTEAISPPAFAAQIIPPGTIVAYGGAQIIPDGWLLCNGDDYNSTDSRYRNLFNAIGTTWGGNGNPTFRVPDFQGLFLRATELTNEVGVGGGTVTALSGIAAQNPGTQTYEGKTGGEPSRRVPGLAHRHTVKMEPPYKYVFYIIKL